ncbi:glycosyl transferase family 2 [Paenibacillus agaridevorans]|uniref:Glycosyl transferase family 2 n=1 Tax=Paenibacillus agaridevorans TaxID=171404 RepID=A0A2R5EID9_9BACL|nr:glycosyltransferase family 2 protein [Paenibacillus agaridevorans]GBG06360.1 glycosyl transferase family 2 [Paenibacillus agaridevorans]
MKTLSLVMITKNEEAVLGRCLDSVKSLVKEIVIADTGSKDLTNEVAATYGAKVFECEWNQHFAEARNFAISKASGDWILVLDADEYISNDCAAAISAFINKGDAIGRIRRIDKFRSKDGVSYASSYISRLFPKHVRYQGRIHEQLDSSLPRVTLPVEVQHDGYFETTRSERNIPLLLMEIEADPANPYYHYQIAKEYRGLEKHEAARQHLQTSSSLLTKRELYYPNVIVDYLYAMMATKQMEIGIQVINENQQQLNDFPDFHFVRGQFYLDLLLQDTQRYIHLFPEIEKAYLECLRIGESNKYESVMGTGSYSALHNLAVFHEVTGNMNKALDYYEQASHFSYAPSIERLAQLKRN